MPEVNRRNYGLFLVFEGVEGAGKTTQVQRLARELEDRSVPHRVVREPGGTEAGERVRAVVLDDELELAPETELFLMLAARAEFVRRLVRPALERGEVVLADRYELSTYAYQGLARGLGLERVRRANRIATGGLKPDALLLLELPTGDGRRRREGPGDRMEREGRAFHERVAAAYRTLVADHPGWLASAPGNVITVDGTGSPEAVGRRLRAELSARWPETFPPGEG